jgi:hypothetical protein
MSRSPRDRLAAGLGLACLLLATTVDVSTLFGQPKKAETKPKAKAKREPLVIPDVPRDQLVCFCLYTVHKQTLKLSAQLYPLKDGEERQVTLEIDRGDGWRPAQTRDLNPDGWLATFRVEKWDDTKSAKYRVTHAGGTRYEGLIRKDPTDKDVIVVGNLSCNSNTNRGPRADIVANLKAQDPDLLFFAGDQSYDHREHYAAWLLFGRQFGEVIKDRPTVTIPDDHDVGHPNLWGAGGKQALRPDGADGGYFMPVEYVNQVQRAQTSHLPDPYDPTPVKRGITVYYTSLNVGAIDFAILEDRKWKTGPDGLVPKMGPRPDHVTDPKYDPAAIDLPEAELLGDRQLKFLRAWGQDWTGTTMKCVLSQTPFANAAHLHGKADNRLVADLDSNGWPQHGRNAALRAMRKAFAVHLCGDQHLAVVVKHGLAAHGDGPYGFTSPALVNTIYGRWWHPADERAGPNPVPGSPLPWTGDYTDGLGNKITMLAYANPADVRDERQRGDGYGLVRFDKKKRAVTFECWPRFADPAGGAKGQYPGWPITVAVADNDGRRPVAWLPELVVTGVTDPVVQVVEEKTGEVVSCTRIAGGRLQPAVFAAGTYTVRVGRDRPDGATLQGLKAAPKAEAGRREVKL